MIDYLCMFVLFGNKNIGLLCVDLFILILPERVANIIH